MHNRHSRVSLWCSTHWLLRNPVIIHNPLIVFHYQYKSINVIDTNLNSMKNIV